MRDFILKALYIIPMIFIPHNIYDWKYYVCCIVVITFVNIDRFLREQGVIE